MPELVQHFRKIPRLQGGLIAAGAVVVLVASVAPENLDFGLRAWMLTGGFGLITVALLIPPRRLLLPLLLGFFLTIFGGISVVLAIPESADTIMTRLAPLNPEQLREVLPAPGFLPWPGPEALRYAAMVTGLGGLAAILAALFVAQLRLSPPERAPRGPDRIERAGKNMVLIGYLGVAAALARFFATQWPVDDLWESAKSFWEGGTYFLMVATFAVPGFALWFQGLVSRHARRREYVVLALCALLFIALLAPTGQRGFAVALGAMFLIVLTYDKILSLRAAAVILAVGAFVIGISQAARYELSISDDVSFRGLVDRAAPDQWDDLFSNQLTSFEWTAVIAENRDRLDVPNSFVAVLAKPVPRSIYPDKSQGFGTEFTSRYNPSAVDQGVSYATPLTSEVDYNFGPVGVIAAFALLGGMLVFVERRVAPSTPRMVEPVVVATAGWTAFELIRGDFANALVFSAAWIVPLVIFSRALGLRRDPPLKRIVIDALQVAPEFSGIGRRISEIAESIVADPLPLPLTVVCPRDARADLESVFPPGTTFRTPIKSSRPRLKRIAYQQLISPFRNSAADLLVCPGDQAPFWGRSPLLFVIHDTRRISRPETASGRGEAMYYSVVMRQGVRRARHILTVSDFSKGEILRELKPACPMDTVGMQPPALDLPRPEGAPPRFLTVGAIRGYKGLDTVIEALSLCEERIEVLCVGGDEGQRSVADRLREMAREKGVEGRFKMLGWIDDDRLRELYGQCVGTVNPSFYEGYGLPVAESLAAGMPTVASSIPAHVEVAGEAAAYFEPGDAAELARVMERVASDGALRERLSDSARSRHEELAAGDRSWSVAFSGVVAEIESPNQWTKEGSEPAPVTAVSGR